MYHLNRIILHPTNYRCIFVRYVREPAIKLRKPIGNTKQLDKVKSSALDLASTLDKSAPNMDFVPDDLNRKEIKNLNSKVVHEKKKLNVGLNTSLELNQESELSVESIGQLETYGDDICEIFNESLHSNSSFYGMIEGAKQPSDVLEFTHVKINKDCSHIMAYWNATFINKFAELVAIEKGVEDSKRVHEKMSNNINQMLQRKESQFRSILIKKMDFRRVPHITFREYTKNVVHKLKQSRSQVPIPFN